MSFRAVNLYRHRHRHRVIMGLSTQIQLAAYAFTVAALGFGSPMPILVATVSGYAELTSADSDTGTEYVFLKVRNIGASISEA
ncbi:MAG: hypothetical protein AAGL66_17895, partial [Pseudomonadota bacterium]